MKIKLLMSLLVVEFACCGRVDVIRGAPSWHTSNCCVGVIFT